MMKPLKTKLTTTEWMINTMKRFNYGKFVKTTLIERRKQRNLNKIK